MRREIIHLTQCESLQELLNLVNSCKCKLTHCSLYKHWRWDFPELVEFIAWFTSLSRYCTLCFGWLVSVMVRVTISTGKNEVQPTTMFQGVAAVQSINKVFDGVDTKYSTNKRMALCYLSGWFYINSNIKALKGSVWASISLTLVLQNQLDGIIDELIWLISDQNIWKQVR